MTPTPKKKMQKVFDQFHCVKSAEHVWIAYSNIDDREIAKFSWSKNRKEWLLMPINSERCTRDRYTAGMLADLQVFMGQLSPILPPPPPAYDDED